MCLTLIKVILTSRRVHAHVHARVPKSLLYSKRYTMAEPSPTAISSSPCHLGGLTRLAFAPDGQYVPLLRKEVIVKCR